MTVGVELGGATLAYVARFIEGSITTSVMTFDEDIRKNVREEQEVESPVIVFKTDGTSVVMSASLAEQKGFLSQPPVLNLEAVDDPNTVAGRFKFSLREKDRIDAWMQMEQAVINRCIANGGIPIPVEAHMRQESIYLGEVA
jgi:hypothetical protein